MPLRILVVEDDGLVRLATAEALETNGFEVLEAANSGAALRLLNSAAAVDIMFTDIDMPPGPDGIALAREVRSRWPTMEIVYASGHPRSPQIPAASQFFSKPYDMRAVARTMLALGQTQ